MLVQDYSGPRSSRSPSVTDILEGFVPVLLTLVPMVGLLGVTYPDLKVIDPLTDLLEENEEVILQLDVTPGEERSLVLIHQRLFVKCFRELELSL